MSIGFVADKCAQNVYTTIPSIPNLNQMTQYQRGKEAKFALEVGVPKHDYFGKLGTTHFAANFKL